MSSEDFLTRLEHQLAAAAERDVAAPTWRRRLAGAAAPLAPRRALAVVPLGAATLLVGVIAAVILSLGGEQRPPAGGAGRSATGPETSGSLRNPGGRQGATTAPQAAPGDATLRPSTARTFVLNGTVRNGVAAEAAKLLETRGATVIGTGNATVTTIARSLVYSTAAAGGRTTPGRTVAQLLGLSVAGLAPPELSKLAPGADVIVLLGSDYVDRRDRRVPLTGRGGARGLLILRKDGGLSFTAEGLPPNNRYFLWGENRAGKPVGFGFATYDRTKHRLAGELANALPGGLTSVTNRRLYVTREKGDQPNRRSMGPVVLDSGRIGG